MHRCIEKLLQDILWINIRNTKKKKSTKLLTEYMSRKNSSKIFTLIKQTVIYRNAPEFYINEVNFHK